MDRPVLRPGWRLCRPIVCVCLLVLSVLPGTTQAEPVFAVSWSNSTFPGAAPTIEPGVPFTVYALALDLPPTSGFEFSVFLPDCMTVLSATLSTPGTDFGNDAATGGRPNYRVGTGGVLVAGAVVELAELLVVVGEDCAGPLAVVPSVPTSFAPPGPGYLQFNCAGCLIPVTGEQPLFVGADDGSPWILWFDSSPEPFPFGAPVELGWGLFGSIDSADIDNGVGAVSTIGGSQQILPTGTSTYNLSVSNAVGTQSEQVVVHLQPALIRKFTATPPDVQPGESTTLSWEVTSAEFLRIDPDIGPLATQEGTLVVTPQSTTTYVLTASNAESSATEEVTVGPSVPRVSLATSDLTPFAVDSIVLTASVQNANSVTLEPGFGSIDPSGGQFVVVVEQPTTFVLTATNAFGMSTAQVEVIPRAPTASLDGNNPAPFATEEIVLSASVQGAASVQLEPGFGNIDPSGGVFRLVVEQSTTFVLTATNPAGVTQAEFDVVPRAPDVSLVASTINPVENASFDLVAQVEGAASVTLLPAFGSIDLTGGTFQTSVDVPTTFTLAATNTVGTSLASVTVTPRPVRLVAGWSATQYPASLPGLLPGIPFDVYILALNVPRPLSRYEFSIALPECANFVAAETFGPDLAPQDLHFIVEPADPALEGDLVLLARITLEVPQVPCNGSIFVEAAMPSALQPPRPAYALTDTPLIDRLFEQGPPLFFNTSDGVADPNDLGVFFDELGVATGSSAGSFEPFHFYVLSFNVLGGQKGYEFYLGVDDRVTVTSETLHPAGSSDFGADPAFPENDLNYLVGTGGVCHSGPVTTLVSLEGLLFTEEDDLLFCLRAAQPSSFNPPTPGYLDCGGELRAYGAAYDGCAVLNPVAADPPVGTVDCHEPTLKLAGLQTLTWDEATRRWELRVALRNEGRGAALQVEAELFEGTSLATLDPRSLYGDIPPGERRWGDPFVLDLTGRDDPGGLDGFVDLRFGDNCGGLHHESLSAEHLTSEVMPVSSALQQNFPNPFNPRTIIPFVLRREGQVVVEVFDARGRRVKLLVHGFRPAGPHQVAWDGTDDGGSAVTAGIYWYRLRHDGAEITRTMALVR